MSNEQTVHSNAAHADKSVQATPAEMPPYVHLFQKAHQNIGLLERIDEQLAQLWEKRHELQEELRFLQTQINKELEDRIHAAGEPPAQLLSAVMGAAGNSEPTMPPIAMRATASRFATQPLSGVAED